MTPAKGKRREQEKDGSERMGRMRKTGRKGDRKGRCNR